MILFTKKFREKSTPTPVANQDILHAGTVSPQDITTFTRIHKGYVIAALIPTSGCCIMLTSSFLSLDRMCTYRLNGRSVTSRNKMLTKGCLRAKTICIFLIKLRKHLYRASDVGMNGLTNWEYQNR